MDFKEIIGIGLGGAIAAFGYGFAMDFTGTESWTSKLTTPLYDALKGAIIAAIADIIYQLLLMKLIK